jgi:hypothetical protein
MHDYESYDEYEENDIDVSDYTSEPEEQETEHHISLDSLGMSWRDFM